VAVEDPAGGLIGPFNAFVHAPEIGRRLLSLGGTSGSDSRSTVV
jgi:hypothetical protein